jgi:hypothetical protein
MAIPFPNPVRQNGRLYFFRSQLEAYKRALAGLPPVEFEGPEVLVPSNPVCLEFGVGRRTLGRRIKASQAAQEQDGGAREAQRAITTAAA